MDGKIIRIIENSGFLETLDSVFDIEQGSYTFIIENKSKKDSGFVVVRNGDTPMVIRVKKGETVSMDINLVKGNYQYF